MNFVNLVVDEVCNSTTWRNVDECLFRRMNFKQMIPVFYFVGEVSLSSYRYTHAESKHVMNFVKY